MTSKPCSDQNSGQGGEATVAACLRAAERQLFDVTETPALDAKLLLTAVLNKDITWLATWPDVPISELQRKDYNVLIGRRAQAEPVAYILGFQYFWGLKLSVTPDVLIPRADTETIVETVLRFDLPKNAKVLDLGTGSGAIALALASEKPHWNITALDMSESALAVAQKNAQQLNLSANIQFLQSHWFNALEKGRGQKASSLFNVIVSNPPYIEPNDTHLPGLKYEPLTALVAQESGLSDIQEIVNKADAFLAPRGSLVIEHGYNQHEAVQVLMSESGFQNVQSIKDFGGNWRCTLAQKQC